MTTPTETPPPTDPIRDAFEAILWFLACLIGPLRPRKLTSAEEIGAEAACEIDTDTVTDEPPDALIKLRDLIQRAAEEHARRTEPQPADPLDTVPADVRRRIVDAARAYWRSERTYQREVAAAVAAYHAEHAQPAEPTDDPPLTEDDLRTAEERCERATPGPWEIDPNAEDRTDVLSPSQQCAICYVPDEDSKDGAFIAAARTDLPRALREIRRLRRVEALVGGLEQANREAHQGLAKRKAEIARLRATTDEQAHRLDVAAKHLGCEPDVIVSCAETRMAEIERLESSELDLIRKAGEIAVRREAEIERLTAMLREARRRLAPLPLAMHSEDHEPDTLPARIDAALGGKDH